MSHFGASRVDSLVAAKSAVVVDLFGEDAAQLKQQLGLEHLDPDVNDDLDQKCHQSFNLDVNFRVQMLVRRGFETRANVVMKNLLQ